MFFLSLQMSAFKGLTNYGCTCYLNAMLQGFFHNDVSKYAFLTGPQDEQKQLAVFQSSDDQP